MSVISLPRLRLPDQVTVKFGSPDLLGRAFLIFDHAVRSQGIYLSISSDFDELADVCERNKNPLLPMFDPSLGGVKPENSFWIRGSDSNGRVVLSTAARLYLWQDSSLAEELESLRFFYPSPDAQKRPQELCIVESEQASHISGRVSYGGAIWVHSEYRGLGLAHIAARLGRAYALTQWYPDYALGMVQTRCVSGEKAAQTYGWPHVDRGFRWFGPPSNVPELRVDLGWFTRDEIADDIDRYSLLLGNAARVPVVGRIGDDARAVSGPPWKQ